MSNSAPVYFWAPVVFLTPSDLEARRNLQQSFWHGTAPTPPSAEDAANIQYQQWRVDANHLAAVYQPGQRNSRRSSFIAPLVRPFQVRPLSPSPLLEASSFISKDESYSDLDEYLDVSSHIPGSFDKEEVVDRTGPSQHGAYKIVTWNGAEDRGNPKNWPLAKKLTTCFIVAVFAFLGPFSSSVLAPSLENIGHDLNIPDGAQLELTMSIFLLALAIGPFFLSPFSEVWGRATIIRCGNLLFLVFTALCGWAQSQAQLIVFRFFAGLGGSATIGMGTAVLSDCFRPEQRGQATSLLQLASVLGPATGPMVGGLITRVVSWRWLFWIVAILSAIVQLAAMFFLRETYGPRILSTRAKRLRLTTGDMSILTEFEAHHQTPGHFFRTTLPRPWLMIATQPIVQLLAAYQAFNFGMLYFIITIFPDLWADRYGQDQKTASLNFISLAVGSFVGGLLCGPLMDWMYRTLKKRDGRQPQDSGLPEFRIPVLVPVSILTTATIFLISWAAEERLTPAVANLGAALFSASTMVSYQSISAYIADAFEHYSASASSAAAFLRSMAAFAFPLFAPYLVKSLGYGIGGSILGIVTILIIIPAPFVFWFLGARLRAASRFARGDGDAAFDMHR